MLQSGLRFLKNLQGARKGHEAGRTVLVTAVRDEAPYLLEWLAHYRALGVDQIRVYHNHCSDETAALLDAVGAGCEWVGVHQSQIKDGQRPQMVAQRHALQQQKWSERDWMLHLDCDEFLVLHRHASLADILQPQAQDVGRVVFNWRVFGSSGQQEYSPEPVTRRFVAACLDPGQRQSRVVKTAFRPLAISGPGIHRPDLQPGWQTAYADGAPAEFVDDGAVTEVRIETAQLNHYIIRSRAEFCHKQVRGAGGGRWSDAQGQPVTRGSYDWRYFERIDASCTGVDESIRRHDKATDEVMAALLAVPQVAEIQQQALANARQRMDELLARIDSNP